MTDATGFVLVRFYCEEAPDRRNELRRLTFDEARRLAVNFAKLPELLEMAKRVGLNDGKDEA